MEMSSVGIKEDTGVCTKPKLQWRHTEAVFIREEWQGKPSLDTPLPLHLTSTLSSQAQKFSSFGFPVLRQGSPLTPLTRSLACSGSETCSLFPSGYLSISCAFGPTQRKSPQVNNRAAELSSCVDFRWDSTAGGGTGDKHKDPVCGDKFLPQCLKYTHQAQDSSKAAVTDSSQRAQSTLHLSYTRVDFTPGQDMSSGTTRTLRLGRCCTKGVLLVKHSHVCWQGGRKSEGIFKRKDETRLGSL